MKSPFPGMDPFMERSWLDAHGSLITYIRDQLQTELPRDLRAQTNQRVFLEERTADEGAVASGIAYPDVLIRGSSAGAGVSALSEVDLEQAAPTGVLLWEVNEPERQNFIEIVDAATGSKVVTIIELISPTNKRPGDGLDAYLSKQKATLRSPINLVEIDLTRAGNRAAVMPWCRSLRHSSTYLAGVYRAQAGTGHRLEYHLLPLETPLKPIAIPLRTSDRDVVLKLQPLVELVYQNGRYYQTDYTTPLNPPLSYAEQAFLAQRLAERQ